MTDRCSHFYKLHPCHLTISRNLSRVRVTNIHLLKGIISRRREKHECRKYFLLPPKKEIIMQSGNLFRNFYTCECFARRTVALPSCSENYGFLRSMFSFSRALYNSDCYTRNDLCTRVDCAIKPQSRFDDISVGPSIFAAHDPLGANSTSETEKGPRFSRP